MKTLHRVLIMAGGTGGHVFPGLALGRYLREHGVDVHWLGTEQGLEARLVPEAGFPLHLIHIKGVRGKGLRSLLMAPITIFFAILAALRHLMAIKPDVVIGLGGFASGPGGVASALLRYPLIIHEQNARAGLTNRLLARLATKVLTGFPHTFKDQAHSLTVGNPVRDEMLHLLPPAQRFAGRTAPLRLLILGGSLGAAALNTIVPEALAQLRPEERPEVYHQTGDKHFSEAKNRYETMQIHANLTPFVKEMSQVYAWADLVICRAGALTIAELCAVGLGAILVPFPHAVDDHQTANARYLVDQGAAILMAQSELTASSLADTLRELSSSPARRLAMAEAAYQLREAQVTQKVFATCQEVCH